LVFADGAKRKFGEVWLAGQGGDFADDRLYPSAPVIAVRLDTAAISADVRPS